MRRFLYIKITNSEMWTSIWSQHVVLFVSFYSLRPTTQSVHNSHKWRIHTANMYRNQWESMLQDTISVQYEHHRESVLNSVTHTMIGSLEIFDTCPQHSCSKVNALFTRVSTFCPQGGVCADTPPHWPPNGRPPDQTPPSRRTSTTPWADTPDPLGRHPPPPVTATAADGTLPTWNTFWSKHVNTNSV